MIEKKQPYAALRHAIVAAFLLSSGLAHSDPTEDHRDAHHQYMEEVVVTAPFKTTAAETMQPINVLTGEALLEEIADTLGETLKGEIGINSASFGSGVGHPIIRGHTGNRIGVLQNGVGTTDVSNQSPDHAEGVEVSFANRIEIIRGPASLLYGSGAIGGVINVIDRRIPETIPSKPAVIVEHTYNDNTSGDRTMFRLDAGTGNFAFHLEGFQRSSDTVEIPGFAIDEAAVEALEALAHAHEGEHEEEEHHDDESHEEDDHGDEEAFPNTKGFIGNSDSESDSGSIGVSFIGERGFIGFSTSKLNNKYGLPPGSHTHAHGDEEEEHHDEDGEHGEGGHEDEHAEEGHEDEHGHGEEVEFVRLDIEQTRHDLRAGIGFSKGFIESVRASLAYTDYAHDEIEYFEDGGQVVGTVYSNEGYEGRVTFNRRATGAWSGVYGLQFTDNEFSAIGEEAFIPESDIQNLGIFGFEQYDAERFNLELGFRYDANKVETGQCDSDESQFSTSGSLLYKINGESNAFLGLTRASRSPSVEELFSNVNNSTCNRVLDNEDLVLHAATNLLEIGNPNLDTETSNNLELGYRYHTGRITGEISAYMNQIDDYIFLSVTGEEFEEQLIAQHLASDAEFRGIEARVNVNVFESERLGVNWSLFGDSVNAEFDAGGNIPLIPANKIGTKVEFYGPSWTLHVHLNKVSDQKDTGEFEYSTEGYDEVSLYSDYHWDLGSAGSLKLFLKANNLTDEEIRNHTSRLKNFAPESGRSYLIGLRYRY